MLMMDHRYNLKLNRLALAQRYQGPLTKWQEMGMIALDKHEVILKPDSLCWSRPHAHTDERTVCKLELPKGRVSLFTLLHEIGHIVHPRGNYRGSGSQSASTRAEAEYNATQWAIAEMRAMGVSVPKKTLAAYDAYIQEKYDRGVRRGLKTAPAGLPGKYKARSKAHRHNWEPSHRGLTCTVCGWWKSG